ncbi:MAG TPA: hypothetical protein VN980_15620 [Alphaproteobacteria bacterium]|nr:hypothetical protein [Alphaproteobacteria bacterium]
MSIDVVRSEREAITKAADDLARQGYEVVREPGRSELPDFLRNFRPDLIAHRGNEHLVVEVKSKWFDKEPRQWRALAEEVRRHPGWQLRLVLSGPRDDEIPPPPSLDEIDAKLSSSRKLYESGEAGAALLLLWSLLEAASYHRLSELGAAPDRPKTPIALLKDLVSFGLLEQKEYDRLRPVISVRNAIAHGRATMLVDRDIFDALVDLVRRLIEAKTEPHPVV